MYENGPYNLQHNLTLSPNPYGWDAAAHMIYIDQPINTGFSYSDVRDRVFFVLFVCVVAVWGVCRRRAAAAAAAKSIVRDIISHKQQRHTRKTKQTKKRTPPTT